MSPSEGRRCRSCAGRPNVAFSAPSMANGQGNVPAPIMGLAARALGLVVHDVVLTPDEIDGLMAGLLVSHEPPLGEIAISDWLDYSRESVGRSYANELRRHFASGRVD